MLSFLAAVAVVRLQSPALVDKVRAALTVENAAPWGQTTLTGISLQKGVEGKYTLQFTADGKFIQSIESPLGDRAGFDGSVHWQADYSGATRQVAFEDAEEQRGMVMVLTSSWLAPNAPVDITVDGNTLHMKLRNSLFQEDLQIDPATNLPSSATFQASAGKVTLGLSDWRAAGRYKAPFKSSLSLGPITDTFTVTDAKGSKDPGIKAFAMPKWTAKDTSFDPKKLALVETKKAFSGHILVHPLVEGKDVGWFILDTGAEVMVIDPKVADKLNMPKIGKETLIGVGGATTASFRLGKSFSLGTATIKNLRFTEFDLAQIGKILNVQLAGIVGYDFMRRTIVGVDLNKPEVRVFNPATYKLPSGAWTAMMFDSGNPVVKAKFEGDREAWFRMDTGANGTVTFHAPFVAKEKLLDGRETRPAMMGGVGGMTSAKMGTLKWFELGSHRFESPVVSFSEAKTGAFTSEYLAGNIGQDFLKPFDLVIDFGGSRVGFLPLAK